MTEPQRALLSRANPRVTVTSPNDKANGLHIIAYQCVFEGWLQVVSGDGTLETVYEITPAGTAALG